MSTVDIRPDHADIVHKILEKFLPDNAVWVFGSRAKWLAKEYSDLDLCIIGDTPLTFVTLGLLDEAFEDSDLPYKVDIVDWATTSPEFRKIIARDKVVLKTEKNKKMDKNLRQDWLKTTLDDLCYVNKNTYSPKDNWDYINYLDTGNLTENKIDFIQKLNIQDDIIPSRAKRKVEKNDILYSTVRPNQKHFGIIRNPVKNLQQSWRFECGLLEAVDATLV